MTESGLDPVTMCGTCFRTLDLAMGRDGVSRVHNAQDPDDHPVVPVPVDERWLARCDFCNDTQPSFALPVRSFTLAEVEMTGSRSGWAACRTCAALIDLNAWGALATRAVESNERRQGAPLGPRQISLIHRNFRLVRKNICGSLRPIQDVP